MVSSAKDEFVRVHVGESKATFHVHKSVLCSSSQYFKAKEKPEWSKPGGAVDSPCDSEDAFNLYVNWLYMRKIPTKAVLSQSPQDHETEWKTLAEAYVLGDALIDTPFKDVILDALYAKVRSTSGHTIWSCGGQITEIIYCLPESSPARRFILDIYKKHAGEKDLASMFNEAPKEFFYDLAMAGKMGVTARALDTFGTYPSGDYWNPNTECHPCTYHSHREPEHCYLKSTSDVSVKGREGCALSGKFQQDRRHMVRFQI